MRMLERLVIATHSAGKLSEFAHSLKGMAAIIEPLPANAETPEETGTSFLENALIKARFAVAKWQTPVLADDSGLVVDALNGAPGLYSARFAGPEASDEDRQTLLLERLKGVPPYERRARFVAAVVLVVPEGGEWTAIGNCEGQIAMEPMGAGGFGYDPVFYFPPAGKTFGQMSLDEKQRVSHRTVALAELIRRFNNVS